MIKGPTSSNVLIKQKIKFIFLTFLLQIHNYDLHNKLKCFENNPKILNRAPKFFKTKKYNDKIIRNKSRCLEFLINI